ncbi:MAG: hypothetical protein AAF517_18030, partial [Planctomycetota bacterium]
DSYLLAFGIILVALQAVVARPAESFSVRRTKHFRIHHRNETLADKISAAAETYLDTIAKEIAPEEFRRPRFKTFHIRVYRDRKEFIENGEPNSRQAVAQCVSTTELRSYESTILGALEHEITHLVVHAFLPSMPMWIQEGFATGGYRAAKPRTYSLALRGLKSGSLLPMEKLVSAHSLAGAGISTDKYYLQSRVALEFLVRGRGGLAHFYRFGKSVDDGLEERIQAIKRTKPRGKKITISVEREVEQPVRDALASHYGYFDLSKFDRDLQRWVQHQVRQSRLHAKQDRTKLKANFDYKHRVESPHFVAFTTSDKKLTEKLLKLAEEVYSEFQGRFWDAGLLLPARMKVYVFDSKTEYGAYLKTLDRTLKFGKHLLPHYNPYAGAACTYRKGITSNYLYQTVAHEVTHGLSTSLFSARSGIWIQEAIAYSVGNSVHARTKKIVLGECHETKYSELASYVRLQARRGQLIPLARLLEPGSVPDSVVARRAQGWALFRFLEDEENGRYRESFHAYIRGIVGQRVGGVAEFENQIEPLREFEPKFVEWAKSLRATSKKR